MKTIAICILLALGGTYFYLDYKADHAEPYGLNQEAEASFQVEIERMHKKQDQLDSSNDVLRKSKINHSEAEKAIVNK